MRLALAAALLVAAPLAAQTNGGSSRLAGRVPAAALPAIDSILATAVAESLPTEPLVQKALEGGAKGIPADRLVSGVRRGMLQLRDARILVARTVPGQPVPEGHVAAVAAALARGLPPPIVERLLTVAPNEPPGPALHAAADLIAHRFNADSAADRELQRGGGRTPSEALDRVRAMLPNVPALEAGPRPGGGAVVTRHGTNGS